MANGAKESVQPLLDFYSRWSKDSFDMISRGMTMYNRMNSAWSSVSDEPSKETPGEEMKKWGDAFGGAYNELLEMYTQPLRMFSPGRSMTVWEDAFAQWQKMFSALQTESSAPAASQDFMTFSKNWFDGYSRICQSWVRTMQKMGETCKSAMGEGESPESGLRACTEISDRFLKEWTAFVTEQGGSFLALWRSQQPRGKKDPPNGTTG